MGSPWKWRFWCFASMKSPDDRLQTYSDEFGTWERAGTWNLWFLGSSKE